MTSIGEMSAASTIMPVGRSEDFEGAPEGDFRRALTTSLTPRFNVRCAAAVCKVSISTRKRNPKGAGVFARHGTYPS